MFELKRGMNYVVGDEIIPAEDLIKLLRSVSLFLFLSAYPYFLPGGCM